MLVGGNLQDPAIVERLPGPCGRISDAPVVLIPTAGGAESYDETWRGVDAFRAAGARHLTVLHTTDRETADTEAFVGPFAPCPRGVWFGGGRQWRLADAYLHTRVHEELRGVLDRGCAWVGGSSAWRHDPGLVPGAPAIRGRTPIMMGDHEEGFGFLRDVGVDQHLLRRNRQFEVCSKWFARGPICLGIGIDEDTAIVVRGTMRSRSLAAATSRIYDHERRLDSGGLFYFLSPGDTYDFWRRGRLFGPGRRSVPCNAS